MNRNMYISVVAALLLSPVLLQAQSGPIPAVERQRIQTLAANHANIKREVTLTETGYVSTLLTDDPVLLAHMKAHIKAMSDRLGAGMPVRMWDPAFVEFFKQYDDISHVMEEIPNGFRMTVTAKTPASIKAAQLHAKVVSDFVANGAEGVQRTHDAAWAKSSQEPRPADDTPAEKVPTE